MRAVAFVFLALSFGCEPAPVGNGKVALGTAAYDGTGYLPLEGDQALVPGSQGGFHIWVKFRLSGMPSQKIKVQREARRVSDSRLLLTTQPMTMEMGELTDGVWELPNPIPAFMCPSPLGVNVVDERVKIHLTIFDEHDQLIDEAAEQATARCPENDQKEFCQRICTG